MDDAAGQLGNYSSEISDLVPLKNGVRFAISEMAALPPRGGNAAIDTVYFTLPINIKHALKDQWFFYTPILNTLIVFQFYSSTSQNLTLP